MAQELRASKRNTHSLVSYSYVVRSFEVKVFLVFLRMEPSFAGAALAKTPMTRLTIPEFLPFYLVSRSLLTFPTGFNILGRNLSKFCPCNKPSRKKIQQEFGYVVLKSRKK